METTLPPKGSGRNHWERCDPVTPRDHRRCAHLDSARYSVKRLSSRSASSSEDTKYRDSATA